MAVGAGSIREGSVAVNGSWGDSVCSLCAYATLDPVEGGSDACGFAVWRQEVVQDVFDEYPLALFSSVNSIQSRKVSRGNLGKYLVLLLFTLDPLKDSAERGLAEPAL
jgi:hypothetical protein